MSIKSKQNATINSGQPLNGNESETTVKMYYHDLSSDQAYRQTNIQVIESAKETSDEEYAPKIKVKATKGPNDET